MQVYEQVQNLLNLLRPTLLGLEVVLGLVVFFSDMLKRRIFTDQDQLKLEDFKCSRLDVFWHSSVSIWYSKSRNWCRTDPPSAGQASHSVPLLPCISVHWVNCPSTSTADIRVLNWNRRGRNHPSKASNLAHWTALENLNFTLNWIFITFTACPTDKDFPHGHSNYPKVSKKEINNWATEKSLFFSTTDYRNVCVFF